MDGCGVADPHHTGFGEPADDGRCEHWTHRRDKRGHRDQQRTDPPTTKRSYHPLVSSSSSSRFLIGEAA